MLGRFVEVAKGDKVIYGAFVIAIILRLHMEFMLPDMLFDKMYQLTTARHLSQGNGISFALANSENLSKFDYRLISVWPPGYALVVAPLLYAGVDFFTAALLIDFLGIFIFFSALYMLLHLLRPYLKLSILPFIPLYLAVAYSPFRLIASTDLLSLAFFLLSWALLFCIIKENKSIAGVGNGMVALFGVSSFVCSFFRFAYYPLSLLLPTLLVMYAIRHDRTKLKQGILAFTITLALISIQLFYQSLAADNINFLDQYYPEPQPRLYFEHLLKFDSVFVNSFFHDFILKKVLKGDLMMVFNLFFTTLMAFLLWAGMEQNIILSIKISNKRKDKLISTFFLFSLIFIITIIVFLTFLSLRYPLDIARNWTFVQESRYFAPVYLLIFLLLSLIVFGKGNEMPKKLRLLGSGVLASSFLFSLYFWLYAITKYPVFDGRLNMQSYYHFSHELPRFLDNYPILESPTPIVFSANEMYSPLSFFLSMEGAAQLPSDSLLNNDFLKSSAPANLLIVVDKAKGDSINVALENYAKLHGGRKLASLQDVQTDIWEIKVDASDPEK